MLPAEGEGDRCLKILAVEYGSLQDLTDTCLVLLWGFSVPAGTVVVICSLSYSTYMATVATVGYAEDLVRAFQTLRNTY
jgi:hypothetical protein